MHRHLFSASAFAQAGFSLGFLTGDRAGDGEAPRNCIHVLGFYRLTTPRSLSSSIGSCWRKDLSLARGTEPNHTGDLRNTAHIIHTDGRTELLVEMVAPSDPKYKARGT